MGTGVGAVAGLLLCLLPPPAAAVPPPAVADLGACAAPPYRRLTTGRSRRGCRPTSATTWTWRRLRTASRTVRGQTLQLGGLRVLRCWAAAAACVAGVLLSSCIGCWVFTDSMPLRASPLQDLTVARRKRQQQRKHPLLPNLLMVFV